MKLKALIASCLALLSATAFGYELKGLTTGMNISTVEERFSLLKMNTLDFGVTNETWITKTLPEEYQTLADQPLKFITFNGVSDGTIKEVKFVFTCGGYERIVMASLEKKFGKSSFDSKRNLNVWKNKSGEMSFYWGDPIKGSNLCGRIVIRDPDVVKWHIEQAKTKPAPASKDL